MFEKLHKEYANKGYIVIVKSRGKSPVSNNLRGTFYFEDDLAHPVNVYGATKLAGESLLRAYCSDYYIFRVSVLFGRNQKMQFVEKCKSDDFASES